MVLEFFYLKPVFSYRKPVKKLTQRVITLQLYKGYRDTTLIVWKERADRICSQPKKNVHHWVFIGVASLTLI